MRVRLGRLGHFATVAGLVLLACGRSANNGHDASSGGAASVAGAQGASANRSGANAGGSVASPGDGGASPVNQGGQASVGGSAASGGHTSAGTPSTGGAQAGAGEGGLAGDGPTSVPPPSCADETGTECQGESCCSAIAVPGGTFPMGDNGTNTSSPEHQATVSDFVLDKYEVTVGRFRRYVAEYDPSPAKSVGGHSKISKFGWEEDGFDWHTYMPGDKAALVASLACETSNTWTSDPGPNEERPINCLNWFVAFAFCAWDGGRLPTEAEWEYAAAGGTENRQFPWGSAAPDATLASFDCQSGGTPGACTSADIAAVGSTPAGNARWGHADLAGSMFEWSRDVYSATWYQSGAGNPCNDCANLANADKEDRVRRGDAWLSPTVSIVARYSALKPYGGERMGVRCARNP